MNNTTLAPAGGLDGEVGSQTGARESLSGDSAGEESQLKAANYSAPKTSYTPFAPVINAYQSGARMRTWILCGEKKSNVLFRVSLHFGLTQRGPLGMRPGIYLHNGTSIKDPVLAAACDEDQWSQRVYAFNNKSVIIVPHIAGEDNDGLDRQWTTELMVGSTTSGDDGVTFRFAINAGPDENNLKRERFEWRKFKKGTDKEYPGGGFKLFRLSRPTRMTEADADQDCVAVWELDKTLLKYWDHMYTLRFLGSGLSDDLGERWRAMVVVTAARLDYSTPRQNEEEHHWHGREDQGQVCVYEADLSSSFSSRMSGRGTRIVQ